MARLAPFNKRITPGAKMPRQRIGVLGNKRHNNLRLNDRPNRRRNKRTSRRIHKIVVRARTMIDRVAAAPSRLALEANKLRNQLLIVEQIYASAIQQR
jgi:hypothetical protein